MKKRSLFALLACVLSGCTTSSEVSFDAYSSFIDEGSVEAFGVLEFLNGPEATFALLDIDVGPIFAEADILQIV